MTPKRRRIIIGVLVFLTAAYAFIHWPLPITNPESAFAVAVTRFDRTMWLHYPPKTWLYLRRKFRTIESYHKGAIPLTEEDRLRFSDPESAGVARFTYGSPAAVLASTEPTWLAVCQYNSLPWSATIVCVLRARDGKLVAVYHFTIE